MRNLKKFLALVLAFMMAMSLMVTANAAVTENKEFSDSNTVEKLFEEDLLVVNGMGIIQGFEDGTFGPQRNVTRGQMAAIVYRLATGDATDARNNIYSKYNKFSDVNDDDWFAGYIGYCADAGYIVGYPDGSFKPHASVTGYQALTMILRAMGYKEPGHNFEGSTWKAETSSTATQRGMLININNTNYRDTLNLPATRELVAEMAFQGATKEMVQWTNAYGYQTTGMQTGTPGTGAKNPSLGLLYYGLTNHKGIVVANQYTGEKATKIGFSLDVAINKGVNIGDIMDDSTGWTVTGDLASAVINDDITKAAYYYNSGLMYDDGTNRVDEYGVTLTFKWNSDLTLFNHAVEVWYDYRGASNQTVTFSKDGGANANVNGSVTYRDDLNTYAVFDRVVKTDVVVAPNAVLNGTVDWTNSTIESLAEAVLNAGFARNADNTAFFNYAFARNDADTYANNAVTAKSGPSPIKANNGQILANGEGMAESTDWPLYLVISNTPGNVVDVVVTLDLTLSKVTQDNNTQEPLSTGIITQNGGTGTNAYFDQFDVVKPTVGNWYSNIANKNRVDSYDAKLGDYTAAIAVTGTTKRANDVYQSGVAGGGTAAATTGDAVAATPLTSTYYYEMDQLTTKVTKSMQKFDQDSQKVYFTDGTSYERSIFALAVDGSFQGHTHVMAPTSAGEYTFYLDKDGKWLFWEQAANTSTFVYGTYIDYHTPLASSSFTYPMVYTNAQGEEKLQANINSINRAPMNDVQYTASMLPKRTNKADNSTGFVKGQYIGYALDANGNLLTVTNSLDRNTGFLQADSTASAAVEGWNDFGTGSTTTEITALSKAIGAQPVGGSGNLFLTERTKFIVVDGAGTDNQKVTVYNGLTELLGTHSSVTIDATSAPLANGVKYLNNGDDDGVTPSVAYAGKDAPWKMVYYSLERAPYDQNYNTMDKYVDTVFIPAPLIDTEDDVSGNLFFVGNSQYGLIDANNEATKFDFYRNGEKSTLWIAGLTDGVVGGNAGTCWSGTHQNDANVVTNLGDNVFYQLHDTGRKAVDGDAIYELIAFTSKDAADKVIIGQYYGYPGTAGTPGALSDTTAAATTITASVTGAVSPTGYLATTRNSQVAYIGGRTADDLFNVASANVLNLDEDLIINSMGDLNGQSSLTSNQGVSVSCVLGEAVRSINFIYVNY